MKQKFFTITEQSTQTSARRGTLVTDHGSFPTPLLVCPADQERMADDHAQVLWSSGLATKAHYHEHQLKAAGGLHGIYHWNGGLITTAGSWEALNSGKPFKLDQKGIHYDDGGKQVFLSPEASAKEAAVAGTDISIALSDCPPYYSSYDHLKKHTEQNNRWMKRAADSHERKQLKLFGVIEGGGLKELRQASVNFVTGLNFDGYAIGGFTKDVAADELQRVVKETAPMLPVDQPRLLSHVKDVPSLQTAVSSGVDIILASAGADIAKLQDALHQLLDNF